MTPTPQDAGLIERLRSADHLHLATKMLLDEAADRLEALSQPSLEEGLGISRDLSQTADVALDQLEDWLRREAARRMDTGYRGSYDPTVLQLEGWIAALAKRAVR